MCGINVEEEESDRREESGDHEGKNKDGMQ